VKVNGFGTVEELQACILHDFLHLSLDKKKSFYATRGLFNKKRRIIMVNSVTGCDWYVGFVSMWERLTNEANERAAELFQEAADRYEECDSFPDFLHPYCFMGGAKENYWAAKNYLTQTQLDGERSLAAANKALANCLAGKNN
jgi:hypothetical protein